MVAGLQEVERSKGEDYGYIAEVLARDEELVGCLDGDRQIRVRILCQYAFLAGCYCPRVLSSSTEMADRYLSSSLCYSDGCTDGDFLRRGYRVAGCSSAE